MMNNGRLWSMPVEVAEEEMRVGNPVCTERYEFYRDVRLRLEQTKPGFALRYEFPDADTARLYATYAAEWYRKESPTYRLRYKVRNHSSACHLYLKREKIRRQ